ncbi:D-2-hydroxyacid dehydrogenase [Shewanella psychrotolerans]|uniref:D-2-hydroxyacid dehydrogenase n=1 Tax=Shewanella psychrotolerans TaxID=2864206 RepID=UPI001C6621D4|nr:D-2-hydroxyacid dehydrogenase [Shewanella psychrotolerans]QYK02171.1 D-2-hydroxyacid dehydrogenase [Shewanella psychrotolerans]
MNIVVLDGYTLNPGDLNWQGFEAFGDFICFDRTPANQLLERAIDAQVLLTNKTVLDAATIAALPKLKYIGVLATGTNVVDIGAAKAHGVTVTNVPGYGPDAVAQMVFAHILHHTQAVAAHHHAVSDGQWSQGDDFCFTLSPLQSLKGKTLGLIGYGDIGRQVATIARAFQMQVLVNSHRPKTDLPEGVTWCELDLLYKQADIISLHCPLTSDTDQMINAVSLARMKPNVLLINTARGGLIDEQALADALNHGVIAAAGVDVLSTEPPEANNPLLRAKNISISPHNAWATLEARANLMAIALDNLKAFIKGDAVNRIC